MTTQSLSGFALPSSAGLSESSAIASLPFQGSAGDSESLGIPLVAVLYARSNSVYKKIPFCDVYDLARDARSYSGQLPVIAHPPCRAWSRLKAFAKPRHDEKELAFHAVDTVRSFGGVLEHPIGSDLWAAAGLPAPGKRDSFGGFTFPINQGWFGHRAQKGTLLYIVGVEPSEMPLLPFNLGNLNSVKVEQMGRSERERTPHELATWLIEVALTAGKRPAFQSCSVSTTATNSPIGTI
jgi:hypothetical protein